MIEIKREVKKIKHKSWVIKDYYLDNYYLVEGRDKAYVIDCGCGLGNPLDEIKNITDKPIELLLTHGHLDHNGNAQFFETVHMNKEDGELAKSTFGKSELVKWYVETRAPERYPGDGIVDALLKLVHTKESEMYSYNHIENGQTFDLGNKKLEAIYTPGHTMGSVSFLDKEDRILYSGDALNDGIIICNKEDGTKAEIKTMRASLSNISKRMGEFDNIARGHDEPVKDKSIILDYLYLCEGLLNGSIEGKYEEKGIRAGKVVRKGLAEFWYEADR